MRLSVSWIAIEIMAMPLAPTASPSIRKPSSLTSGSFHFFHFWNGQCEQLSRLLDC
jgi:hypothetical protein